MNKFDIGAHTRTIVTADTPVGEALREYATSAAERAELYCTDNDGNEDYENFDGSVFYDKFALLMQQALHEGDLGVCRALCEDKRITFADCLEKCCQCFEDKGGNCDCRNDMAFWPIRYAACTNSPEIMEWVLNRFEPPTEMLMYKLSRVGCLRRGLLYSIVQGAAGGQKFLQGEPDYTDLLDWCAANAPRDLAGEKTSLIWTTWFSVRWIGELRPNAQKVCLWLLDQYPELRCAELYKNGHPLTNLAHLSSSVFWAVAAKMEVTDKVAAEIVCDLKENRRELAAEILAHYNPSPEARREALARAPKYYQDRVRAILFPGGKRAE